MVVPLDCFRASSCEAFLSPNYTRRSRAIDGPVLDRDCNGLFYVLDHAGVLLDADVSGDGPADRIGISLPGFTNSDWDSRSPGLLRFALSGAGDGSGRRMAHTCARRHLAGAGTASGAV